MQAPPSAQPGYRSNTSPHTAENDLSLTDTDSIESVFEIDKLFYDIAIEIFIKKVKILSIEVLCQGFNIVNTLLKYKG